MTNDGGGWTLAMRFAGSGSQFTFNSPYWNDTNTLNESDLDPAGTSDAKYETFSLMEADAIRGCMSRGSYSGCKSYTLPQSQTL